MRPSRRLDVLQGHDLAGVFLAHRPAEKLLVVEDPDLGQVARIIANGDGVADIGRQGRVAVAQPLEANAVAPHDARLGVHHQQQIEVFEAVGQARQEAGAAPGIQGRLVRLAMHAPMIRAGDVGGERAVQFGQGQAGHGHRLPVHADARAARAGVRC